MSCLSEKLIERLCDVFTVDQLSELKDKRDKLESKLFMRKTD
jgi:hypothetical protein